MAHHVYLHSEDLDGWLAPPNDPLLPLYRNAFRRLQGLVAEQDGDRHELQIVLNSGKAPDYLEAQAHLFGGAWVIACNGAVWRRCGGETGLTAGIVPEFARLRELLGIPPGAVGVVPASVGGHLVEVAVEEGKRWEGCDIVLTLFTEPERVPHRWRFRGGLDRRAWHAHLSGLVRHHGLALAVLPPHGDGALDVVPVVEGRAVDKGTLPAIARRLYSEATLHLTHGGDGLGDLPAMEAPGVLPLTAAPFVEIAEVVRRRGGVVSRQGAPTGGAALECYAELARRGFYGPLSAQVEEICAPYGAAAL